jgi:hypothetical protein
MRKLKIFGLLALILAIGLFFASCGDNSEPDTWSAVTSLRQLDGTWTGSVSTEKHTYKEWFVKWERTWSASDDALYGSMSMEQKFDTIWTFNSAAKTFQRTDVYTQTYSGGKIDSAWTVMKTWDWTDSGKCTVAFNDNRHSVVRTYINNYSTDDSWLQRYQINQNGKKIKRLNYTEGKDLILSK